MSLFRNKKVSETYEKLQRLRNVIAVIVFLVALALVLLWALFWK
jgi:hypothetical protein